MAALAADLRPRAAQRLAESPQFIGAIAFGIDQALSQNIEECMKSAGDKVEVAFALLQERITKTIEMANDALQRLEVGDSKIAQQHGEIQIALDNMNTQIEDTRSELNQDSNSTKQHFGACAAQVQTRPRMHSMFFRCFVREEDLVTESTDHGLLFVVYQLVFIQKVQHECRHHAFGQYNGKYNLRVGDGGQSAAVRMACIELKCDKFEGFMEEVATAWT